MLKEPTEVEHPTVAAWRRHMTTQGLSKRTITERVRAVCAIVGDGDPATFTVDDVERFFESRPGLSPSSRATYISHIHAFCKWAVLRGVRDDDPTVLLGKPPVRRGLPRAVTTQHVGLLLAAARRRRMRAMILLAAFQGLRASEIAAVAGEDFDLLGGRLHVRGKGGVDADLVLHPRVWLLASAEMPRQGWWFPRYDRPDEHVLGNSVSNSVSKFMASQGVPGTCHSLRHWHATELVAQGVNVAVVKELMRHSSLATTGLYVRVQEQARREALSQLSA